MFVFKGKGRSQGHASLKGGLRAREIVHPTDLCRGVTGDCCYGVGRPHKQRSILARRSLTGLASEPWAFTSPHGKWLRKPAALKAKVPRALIPFGSSTAEAGTDGCIIQPGMW